MEREIDHRPWGMYEVLDAGEGFKVKRIEVKPGQRLSLQSHERRSEHWVVVRGVALVTRDKEEITVATGEHIDIPQGARHRIMNPGGEKMIFVEVQSGEYLGEDDIVRYEDDYGRQ